LSNVVGPRIDTPFTRYFRLPVVPTVLGFDARLQLLHEDDAVAVMHAAAFSDVAGPVNVAGDGVLMMSQAVARAGRPQMPVPAFFGATVGGLLKRGGLVEFAPEDVGFLTYGRVIDTTRLHATMAPTLGYTTAEAFADFVRGQIRHADAVTSTTQGTQRHLGLVPAASEVGS
jgi:UDP-glucose 4-epimerase